MAEIWLATLGGADGFEKPLVLKRILPQYAKRRSFVEMFVREAKMTSGLSHASIVQIYELGQHDGEYYIAMEYVKGWDLLKVLHKASLHKRPIPPALALHIAARVCDGLAYAHNARTIDEQPLDIIHLDVSPSNILLDEIGAVKLTDFGVARAALEQGGNAGHRRLRGKIAYMSPEQVTGVELDNRTDIFAAGVVLYELFTLKRLFRAKTSLATLANVRAADIEPRLARHSQIPARVKDILRKALARKRDDRYDTAAQMRDDIEGYLFDCRRRTGDGELAGWLAQLFRESHPDASKRGSQPRERSGTRTFSWGRTTNATLTEAAAFVSRSPSSVGEATRSALRKLARSRYVFQKTSGSGHGPVPWAGVLQLVRSRSVSPDELVSIDGSDWRPVRTVAQLSDALARAFPPDAEQPLDAGVVNRFSVAGLLASIAATMGTGRLCLIAAATRKDLFFRQGKLIFAASTRKDELLGPFLANRGAVNHVQLEVAHTVTRTFGDAIGPELVRLGFLEPGSLYRLAREHLAVRLTQIFTWEDGCFGWFPGEEPPPDAVLIEMETLPLITRGVREHLNPGELAAYFERLDAPRLHRVRQPPFDPELLHLLPRELRFARQIDGSARTANQLLQELPPGDKARGSLLNVLFLLHQTGHLVSADRLPERW